MPSGIEDEDSVSERDILIPKDLPSNNSISFAEKESIYFDIPPFSRPPAKPPDGDTGILNIKMMGDIYDQKVFMHKLMITLASHQEKSPDLLSHRCGTTFKTPFILEESPVDTMADQRTMAELLCAPTEGYAEAIVVPSILAEQFKLKHSLINMMTSDQFFGLEKDNPHDHIRAARRWLEKESPRSILTWEDLFQATPPPASVKAVEEICVTCGGAHPYYQCLAAGGNTFQELKDNIQGYVAAAAVNYNQDVQNNQNRLSQPQGYNQGNNFNPEQSYQAPTQQNQVVPLSELEKVKRMNEANMKAMQTQINKVKNELRNEMKNSIQASMSNQTNELKNMMASFFQMNTAFTSGSRSLPSNTIVNPKGELKAITTRSGIVLDGPFVYIPLPFINPEEDERVEETLTDQDLIEYTINVPPPLKLLKALLSNKEKLLELENTPLNENCSAIILKKLPENLKTLGNFSFLVVSVSSSAKP
nr:hypothetical protein [Tanacetum cinerariifolium]